MSPRRSFWICCAVIVATAGSSSFAYAAFENVEAALEAFEKHFSGGSRDRTAEEYIRTRFTEALRSPKVLEIRYAILEELLTQRWIVEEVEVLRMLEKRFASDPADAVTRFALSQCLFVDALNPTQLRNAVHSEVLRPKDIIGALARKVSNETLKLRFPNQLAASNVIDQAYSAEMVSGIRLDETSTEDFLGSPGLCSHEATSSEGIIIKLGAGFTLDTIVIKVDETNGFNVSISVSLEGDDWTPLDTRFEEKYVRQYTVSFKPTRLRYIRLLGTSGRVASEGSPAGIRVRALEATYSRKYK